MSRPIYFTSLDKKIFSLTINSEVVFGKGKAKNGTEKEVKL